MAEKQSDSENSKLNTQARPDLWTLPNGICIVRILVSPVLVLLASQGAGDAFLWLYLVLALSDWLDGKLAILLDQRSEFGARLDTWSDAILYASLLIGAWMLWHETLVEEIYWFVPALLAYAVSVASCLVKFRRWPSYHTRLAKVSWLLILVGIFSLAYEVSLWPLRGALVVLAITNIEAILLTLRLSDWNSDVPSIFVKKHGEDTAR